MKVRTVDVHELKPFPGNPRMHPDSAIEKLKVSIKKFGWTNPILASKDGYILSGHARAKAAQQAGITKVPVIYLDLEGEKAKAYLLADNRLREDTYWDYEQLRELLLEIQEEDLGMLLATGFDEQRTENIVRSFSDDQFVRPDVTEIANQFETREAEGCEDGRNRESAEVAGATTKKKNTGSWFYIQYYGQGFRFSAIKETFNRLGVMKTPHEIDANFFYDLIMPEVGGEEQLGMKE